MSAGVCAEGYGKRTAQDYLAISKHQASRPRKRKLPPVVNTIMRILQDVGFADGYLKVVEGVVKVKEEGVGEETVVRPREQKWMRRKRRIEMFQDEVWEAFLEGKVENPFKKRGLYEAGDARGCEGFVPTRLPSNVPDPGVIDAGALFFSIRNDTSGRVRTPAW